MPEILTESFCERCGTRYTFESTAPRKARRLGQFKTLSKGLKNYVLTDDSSLDEAMALARSDEERELTTQQLDAFHATFNFCMTCRQYTCGNCWNNAEGRCLTCAPHLGNEMMPAPFSDEPQFHPMHLSAEDWPSVDLVPEQVTGDLPAAEDASAADLLDEGVAAAFADAVASAEPGNGAVHDVEPIEEIDLAARLAHLDQVEPTDAPSPFEAEAAIDAPAIDSAALDDVSPVPEDPDQRAAAAASQTTDFLARFRPGQNLDAELAAYEAKLAAEAMTASAPAPAAEPEPVVADVVAEPAPEPFVAEVVAEPEPVAAEVAAEPEPVVAEVVAEPEPVAAADAAEPEAAPTRKDRVEQPTWRIFAPDAGAPVNGHPVDPGVAAAPPTPKGEPQWPARPDWPESPSMSLLANRSRQSSDALWAASSREVLAGPAGTAAAGGTAPGGVQPCSSCGLSLSATARFCRRCGTRQGA